MMKWCNNGGAGRAATSRGTIRRTYIIYIINYQRKKTGTAGGKLARAPSEPPPDRKYIDKIFSLFTILY